MYYQIIDIEEIYLTENMKMLIPFSIWISTVPVQPQNSNMASTGPTGTPITGTKIIGLRHEDKKGFIAPEFLVVGADVGCD